MFAQMNRKDFNMSNSAAINNMLSKLYNQYTSDFLSEYRCAFHDDNAPSRINEFGIIDETRFDTNHRILIVAKETNGWRNEEFDEGILFRTWMEEISLSGLQGHDHIRKYPTMWYNIGRWITLIQYPETDLTTLSKEKRNALTAIGTAAFTNINKVRGNNKSGKAYKQMSYSDIAGTVLREEIEIIQPKVVLCCGTYSPFHYHMPNYNGKVFIMPHPAARKSSSEMLNDLLQQIIK